MRTNAERDDAQTILVIEDDLDIQDVIVGFFRPRGFKIVTYEDAEKALDDIKRQNVICDVILTDLRLPNMTGIEFTERAKVMGLDLPIILMTGQNTTETAVQAIEAGAYDFIVKPLHFPQLHVSVARALHFNRIRKENESLRAVVRARDGSSLEGVIGKSPGFLRAIDLARRVANSQASVLVTGESGTGKEVIARALHFFSTRKEGPFVAINCSAIPENLLESELFGYAKGSFTGASDTRVGLFEEAEGGTIFLDEIGDLSLPLQAKLLRVIQEKKIKRIGENQERSVDVRIVSATHKDLQREVAQKSFREDLFFRLNVIPIHLPPLRERQEDILPLAEFFLTRFAATNEVNVRGFAKNALERLLKHPWRGNVRELENTIERAVVLCRGDLVEEADLFVDLGVPQTQSQVTTATIVAAAAPADIGDVRMPLGPDGRLLTLEELTQSYVKFAIERNGGAKDRTARELGIDRKTLYRRVQELQTASVATIQSLKRSTRQAARSKSENSPASSI